MTTAATPLHVRTDEKRATALGLRSAGATYREIAAQMELSLARAYQLVMEGLEELRREANESAAETRDIELARLDRLYLRFRKKLDTQGDVPDEATGMMLIRIGERRAKLLGLDAPQEIVGAGGGPIQVSNVAASEEFMARVEKLVERLNAGEAPDDVAASIRATVTVVEEQVSTNGAERP